MKIQEYEVFQDPKEPPRRYFTDNNHIDLIIWYQDWHFVKIIGFQVGYKENPFDTDKEYFVSHFPQSEDPSKIDLSETSGAKSKYPAPKIFRRSQGGPPKSFYSKAKTMLEELPPEIANYLAKLLPKENGGR